MNRFGIFIVLLITVFVFGCSHHSSTIEAQKQEWSQEGWKYLETFGHPADDAAYSTFVDSKTADSLTAYAYSGNTSTNHIYEQTNALYLIVTMQRSNGDTFALIFEKPKP
jgi:hypothetical protein